MWTRPSTTTRRPPRTTRTRTIRARTTPPTTRPIRGTLTRPATPGRTTTPRTPRAIRVRTTTRPGSAWDSRPAATTDGARSGFRSIAAERHSELQGRGPRTGSRPFSFPGKSLEPLRPLVADLVDELRLGMVLPVPDAGVTVVLEETERRLVAALLEFVRHPLGLLRMILAAVDEVPLRLLLSLGQLGEVVAAAVAHDGLHDVLVGEAEAVDPA